jgi:hypothetical protein
MTSPSFVFPACPSELAADLRAHVATLARAWAEHPARPRPTPAVREHWAALVRAWSTTPDLPLYVRKAAGNRGALLTHRSGRALVPTDNSPAHWAFTLACGGEQPTVDDIRARIEADAIPVAMVLKRAEREAARFRRVLGEGPSPNAAGWKLGHLAPAGLNARGPVEAQPSGLLQERLIALMDPGNMFVVPQAWAGLAELPEVVAAIRAVDAT